MGLRRISGRGIIIKDNKLVVIKRIKTTNENQFIYYVLPGGGKNSDETIEECIKREVYEELGLTVSLQSKLCSLVVQDKYEHFYLCNTNGSIIFNGQGEEYERDPNEYGKYEPMLIELNELNRINLFPSEIKQKLIETYLR